MQSNNAPCHLCGSQTILLTLQVPVSSFDAFAARLSKSISHCKACGYERNAAVTTFEDAIRLQSHFDTQPPMARIAQTRWPARAALIARKINRLMPAGGRALDIGCNTGVNLKALGEHWNKVGIEPAVPLAQVARTFVPAQIHETSIEHVGDDLGTFDLVTAHAVIEHLFDPVSFVRRIHSLLRPGGLLVMMTGDRESQLAIRMRELWPLYISSDHVSFFSARSLRQLLSNMDFDVISEDWRFMYFADGVGNPLRRGFMKACEIMGWIAPRKFDTYYLYARKSENR